MIRLWTLGGMRLADDRGASIDAVAVQSKRFAVLTYLALAVPPGWQRRDILLALFWPELDATRGRHALRQTLHFLRSHLGPDVVCTRGAEEVAIGPGLWCDALAFADAGPAEALDLYRGDLLPGFFVRDAAPEFDRWLDARRGALRAHAVTAAGTLAATGGDRATVVRWLREGARLAPLDEQIGRRLAGALADQGDHPGALQVLEGLTTRLRQELEVPAAPETVQLSRQIREAAATAGPRAGPSEPVLHPSPAPSRPARVRRYTALAATVIALLLVSTALVRVGTSALAASRPAIAESLFAKGLDALDSAGDPHAALGLFQAALAADSTFARAAYYAAGSAEQYDGALANQWYARADRLASLAPERDRLLVRGGLAFHRNDPSALALADSLVTRHPGDRDGELLLGSALLWHGAFPAAIIHLRRRLALEGPRRPGQICTACAILQQLTLGYRFQDSLVAAEATVRQELRLDPRSPHPWSVLSEILTAEGRYGEAGAALHHAAELSPGQQGDPIGLTSLAIVSGDFASADAILNAQLRLGTTATRQDALWWRVIERRIEGRLTEALADARAFRRAGTDVLTPGLEAIPEAQVLFELGRFGEAAHLFESIANRPQEPSAGPGQRARTICWALAHAAEAWAALGDTARVLALDARIAREATHSLYGRDEHLPDHLRGLIWLARARPDSAAVALRAAIFSPAIGYTRTNLALAKTLLSLHHPEEAVTILRAALAGALDGSGYYATRTELHQLLGEAFEASGAPDSAAAHYAWVVAAWSAGDPPFRARAAALRARLAVRHTERAQT